MKNQTKALLIAVAALGAVLPAVAAENTKVSAAFGNTVISVYPDGRSQKVWMQPDGTWEGQSRRGNPLAGTWAVKGEHEVCVKQSKPAIPFLTYCIAFPDDPHVGSTWAAKDMTGTAIQLKIVKGKVTS